MPRDCQAAQDGEAGAAGIDLIGELFAELLVAMQKKNRDVRAS